MRVGIMSTNHGTHSPEKWAAETAAQLVDVIHIEPTSIVFDAMSIAKAQFEADLAIALVDSHVEVSTDETDALNEGSLDRLNQPLVPGDDHLNQAVDKVLQIADKSMFASHFRKPEVKVFVRSTVGSHFVTVRHIHRSWHADKHPEAPQAQAYRARFHG
jgi:hypothetical protein